MFFLSLRIFYWDQFAGLITPKEDAYIDFDFAIEPPLTWVHNLAITAFAAELFETSIETVLQTGSEHLRITVEEEGIDEHERLAAKRRQVFAKAGDFTASLDVAPGAAEGTGHGLLRD